MVKYADLALDLADNTSSYPITSVIALQGAKATGACVFIPELSYNS